MSLSTLYAFLLFINQLLKYPCHVVVVLLCGCCVVACGSCDCEGLTSPLSPFSLLFLSPLSFSSYHLIICVFCKFPCVALRCPASPACSLRQQARRYVQHTPFLSSTSFLLFTKTYFFVSCVSCVLLRIPCVPVRSARPCASPAFPCICAGMYSAPSKYNHSKSSHNKYKTISKNHRKSLLLPLPSLR